MTPLHGSNRRRYAAAVDQLEWIVVCSKLVHMAATKEDKLRRLAEMKEARMLHRSLEGQRACELLRNINKADERERSHLCCSVFPPRTLSVYLFNLVQEYTSKVTKR